MRSPLLPPHEFMAFFRFRCLEFRVEGMGVQGFRGLGFRVEGMGAQGFRGLGLRVWEFRVVSPKRNRWADCISRIRLQSFVASIATAYE